MEEHLEDFIIYIGSEKGLSPHSIEAYRRNIISFIDFLANRSVLDFNQVCQEDILAFLESLKAAGKASSTVTQHLMAIKVLFRFLKREKIITDNITRNIESPKLWQMIPDVLSLKEVEALLAVPNPEDPIGARDKAILELLYSSGLRVSELCRLNIYDVGDEFVKLFGKGSKERIVPVGKFAQEAIDHYLLHFRSNWDSEKVTKLFVSKSGRPLDRIAIWRMIKALAKVAGIIKEISPHTMRHSFATHLLDNGAELRVIQELLGHASITSTDRYTHISSAHIKRAFDAFSPKR